MIPITLSNGNTIEVEDESMMPFLVVRVNSFADVDRWKNIITESTINGAKMGNNTFSDLRLVMVNASLDISNTIRVEFVFEEKPTNEILLDRISELEDAVNFLLMGGNE